MSENNTGYDTTHEQMQETIKRRAAMVDALNTALEIFITYGEETIDKVMANGIRMIAEATGLNRVGVFRYKDTAEGKRLGMTYFWDKAKGGSSPVSERLSILPDNQVINEWLSILFKGYYINNRIHDMSKEEADLLNQFKITSIFMVPIFTHGSFWGIICLLDHASDEYFIDKVEVDILQLAARLIAKMFLRAEAEREADERNELSNTMFNASPIGMFMFDENCRIINCNDTILNIFDITKESFTERFFELSPEFQNDGSASYEKGIEYMKRALNGERLTIEWMHRGLDGAQIPCEATLTSTTLGEKQIGLAYTNDLRDIKEMEENILILETEAKKIYYDALTGIYNRRYFDENINLLLKILSRSDGMLSLLMIDIDHFKQYNDTYGHSEGDNCLKIIARTLAENITRDMDFVVRYGGEEFVVVLPNTDKNGACIIAEKLLQRIRDCNIAHKNNDAADCVTISIGVTAGKVEYTQTSADYVKRADEMLYISKQGGRNRYTYSDL